MQAILIKYLPATNTKGNRLKATAAAGSITIGYPHELSGEDAYRAAGDVLVARLGWQDHGEWVMGCLPSGDYVMVCKGRP